MGKSIVTVIVLFVIAILVAVLVIFVLIAVNEEPRKRCGNCTAFDRDLRICWWDRIKRDEYDNGCVSYEKKEASDE